MPLFRQFFTGHPSLSDWTMIVIRDEWMTESRENGEWDSKNRDWTMTGGETGAQILPTKTGKSDVSFEREMKRNRK